MIWLFFVACQDVDAELLSIKEKAFFGDWETVEQAYIERINRSPDRDLYRALSKVYEIQEKPVLSQVMKHRAESLSDLTIWGAGLLFFVGLCLLGWNRSRWSWIFVGTALGMLAFYEDVRYKGSVFFEQTNVFHTRSNRGIPLFSLEKGSTVGIIEEDSGYILIEFEQKRGWVEQKKVLSWNPTHSLQIKD